MTEKSKPLFPKTIECTITHPPGFQKTCLKEIETILTNLDLPGQKTPEIKNKNAHQLTLTHSSILPVVEILFRSLTLTDIEIVIFKKKNIRHWDALEKALHDFYINDYLPAKSVISLSVDSTASKLFHEKEFKNRLELYFKSQAFKTVPSENVGLENEDAVFKMTAKLFKDTLTISLSLAGEALYKRGYKPQLTESLAFVAPLREDLAQCCLQSHIEKFPLEENVSLYAPFGGSGTFILEYFLLSLKISPALVGRKFAYEKTLFFNEKHFAFLLKKAKKRCEDNLFQKQISKIVYLDNNAKAFSTFKNLKECFFKKLSHSFEGETEILKKLILLDEQIEAESQDYFKFSKKWGNSPVLSVINPPYGQRMGHKADFFSQIAETFRKNSSLSDSLILLPSEEDWSEFLNRLGKNYKTSTQHFTQGGKDIRLLHFKRS